MQECEFSVAPRSDRHITSLFPPPYRTETLSTADDKSSFVHKSLPSIHEILGTGRSPFAVVSSDRFAYVPTTMTQYSVTPEGPSNFLCTHLYQGITPSNTIQLNHTRQLANLKPLRYNLQPPPAPGTSASWVYCSISLPLHLKQQGPQRIFNYGYDHFQPSGASINDENRQPVAYGLDLSDEHGTGRHVGYHQTAAELSKVFCSSYSLRVVLINCRFKKAF